MSDDCTDKDKNYVQFEFESAFAHRGKYIIIICGHEG